MAIIIGRQGSNGPNISWSFIINPEIKVFSSLGTNCVPHIVTISYPLKRRYDGPLNLHLEELHGLSKEIMTTQLYQFETILFKSSLFISSFIADMNIY